MRSIQGFMDLLHWVVNEPQGISNADLVAGVQKFLIFNCELFVHLKPLV